MSFALKCPNCGERPVSEFRHGGEDRAAPRGEVSPEAWAEHVYNRRNADGPQDEWWYHRLGCKSWFMAHRDTHTNKVFATWWPDEARPAQVGGTDDPAPDSPEAVAVAEP